MAVPVTAQDDWSDRCTDARTVSTGTYSGELAPKDVDILALERENGDSVFLNFSIANSKTTFTVVNKRVSKALFNAGSKSQFEKAVNDPDAKYGPRHLHNLDYSLSPGFAKWQDDDKAKYMWMGGHPNAYDELKILSYDPTAQVVERSPLFGPLWTTEPGTVTTTMFFSTDDPLCLRLQTTNKQKSGAWQLTVRNESPTTQTPTSSATPDEATPTDATSTPTSDDDSSENDVRDSDGDGVIDSEDYAPRDPDVQERSDIRDGSGGVSGFGVGASVAALLVGASVAVRRS